MPEVTVEREAALDCAAADVHAPASNTAAVVTYAAVPGARHVVTGFAWSYNADPTNGNVKIEDVAGTTIFTMDITSKGPGLVILPRPKRSAAANTAMIITLAAGGASVTGKLSILSHYTEP